MSEVKQLTYGELLELTEGHGASAIYERLLPLYTDFDALLAQVAQLQGELREYKESWHRRIHEEINAVRDSLRIKQVIMRRKSYDECLQILEVQDGIRIIVAPLAPSKAESHLARLREALVGMDLAITKFLNDINMLPPWKDAAGMWAVRCQELNQSRIDIAFKAGASLAQSASGDYKQARGCAPSQSGMTPEEATRKLRDEEQSASGGDA